MTLPPCTVYVLPSRRTHPCAFASLDDPTCCKKGLSVFELLLYTPAFMRRGKLPLSTGHGLSPYMQRSYSVARYIASFHYPHSSEHLAGQSPDLNLPA